MPSGRVADAGARVAVSPKSVVGEGIKSNAVVERRFTALWCGAASRGH